MVSIIRAMNLEIVSLLYSLGVILVLSCQELFQMISKKKKNLNHFATCMIHFIAGLLSLCFGLFNACISFRPPPPFLKKKI